MFMVCVYHTEYGSDSIHGHIDESTMKLEETAERCFDQIIEWQIGGGGNSFEGYTFSHYRIFEIKHSKFVPFRTYHDLDDFLADMRQRKIKVKLYTI